MAFPSTFLDIQNAVIAKARLDPILDLQKTKDWINQIYTQVCVETEATIASATMNLTAGASSYTLPAAVARIKQMYLVPAGQTAVVGEQPPMTRTSFDDLLMKRQTGGAQSQVGAYSMYYALLGTNVLELWPTPAAADVVTIYYIAFPTPLSANGDVTVIEESYATKLLEFGALAQAGDFKGDPATAEWQQEYQDWTAKYLNHLDQKQGDLPVQKHTWGGLTDTRDLYSGWGGWRG